MHTLCTSGFMDDVMTARNGPYGAWLIGRILKVSHKGAALGASVRSAIWVVRIYPSGDASGY